MIGIMLATSREAEPLLALAGITGGVAEGPTIYDLRPARPLAICICGMGPVRARAGVDALLNACAVTAVINVGGAGALVEGMDIGGIFSQLRGGGGPAAPRAGISEDSLLELGQGSVAAERDGHLMPEALLGRIFRISEAILWPETGTRYACRSDRWLELPSAVLATVARPVFEPARRGELARHADLVDMEGAGIAQGCQARGVPLYAIKGVTDLAGPTDRQRLLANLDRVSQVLAERVWREL